MIGKSDIKKLLEQVRDGKISSEDALKKLSDLPFKDLGHTKIDNHRELRTGYPEVNHGVGTISNKFVFSFTPSNAQVVNGVKHRIDNRPVR